MAKAPSAEVKFMDGTVFSKRTIFIAARLLALDDDEIGTRLFNYCDGEWVHVDLDIDVWAICSVRKPVPTVFSVGKDGKIDVNVDGKPHEEVIKNVDEYGYISDARVIAGTPYICGHSGQVYRRVKSGWAHLDEGLLEKGDPLEVTALNAIDGTSEKDIYTCGDEGALWHYNGRSWKKLPSPSPVHLNGVCCVQPKEVYLAGNDGIFLKGYEDEWEVIPVPPRTGDFSAVEHFQDKIYLAADKGLFVYDGKKVERVVTGLKPTPDAFRLDVNDGVLWSFGEERLCFFDGKKWTYVKHPDNPE